MVTIKRISIIGGNGDCNDKAYQIVKDMDRRYGNSVTFALESCVNSVISELETHGLRAQDDGYSIKISEPKDYQTGNTILVEGWAANVPMVIINIIEDDGQALAKVKYAHYPRKKAVYVKVKTQNEFELDLLEYGVAVLNEFKINHECPA